MSGEAKGRIYWECPRCGYKVRMSRADTLLTAEIKVECHEVWVHHIGQVSA